MSTPRLLTPRGARLEVELKPHEAVQARADGKQHQRFRRRDAIREKRIVNVRHRGPELQIRDAGRAAQSGPQVKLRADVGAGGDGFGGDVAVSGDDSRGRDRYPIWNRLPGDA